MKKTLAILLISLQAMAGIGPFPGGSSGGGGGGSGTVTSVSLALPSIFTVSGSPVTSSGTLTGALATQTANIVFAGPSSGGAATPTFRSLVASDIPSLSYVNTVGAFSASSQTNGASISTNTITFGPADTTNPGMVSTVTQVLAGVKRFQDNLYVGSAPSTAFPFSVDATMITQAGSFFVGNIIGRRTVPSNDSSTIYANLSQADVTIGGGITQSGNVAGLLAETKLEGTGTMSIGSGVRGVVTNVSTGTITNAASFRAGTIANAGGGTVVSAYGVYVSDQTAGTHNYGHYSGITSGTNKFAFMDAGGADSYFKGNIIKINNVTTNWPSSQGAANTYLKNDGSGNFSWATVSGGSGDVVGPASSVDGNIATMNGTTGKLIRSESKFTINPTTGGLTQTFASTPAYLNQMDVSTATGWSAARYVTGTVAATGNDLYVDDQDFSYALASGKKFVGRYYHPTFSSTTNERVLGDFVSLSAAASQAGWGGWQISAYGVFGSNNRIYNSSTTGAAGGGIGTAQGNQAIGYRGVGVANIGSSGKAAGISGTASTTGSAAIAVGGYFSLDANYDSGTETEVFPNVTAAVVANNGDTSSPAFVAQNNGTTVLAVNNSAVTTVTGSLVVTNGSTLGATTKITRQIPTSVVTLTDGATVAVDASLGNTFSLTAAGDRTILAPTNAQDGQKITIKITASGGSRTITLTTGSAGAFRYGTDITALTATSSGLTDYVGCIYNAAASRWDVIAYAKGY